MFNYDWFHGPAFEDQRYEARRRCIVRRFPDVDPEQWESRSDIQEFAAAIEVRSLIYLRDGFSYEVKDLAEVPSKSNLIFECEPVDERYRVGAFVVSVPFDELVRVEVFAVHASEKPDELPQITGFRQGHDVPEGKPPKPGR